MTAYEELLKRAYELYKAGWCAVRGYGRDWSVAEDEDRAWKYSGTVSLPQGQITSYNDLFSVTVTNIGTGAHWFNGAAYAHNIFGKGASGVNLLSAYTYTGENAGDIPEYVRAAVSVYWQTEDGAVLSDVPVEGEDYSIEWGGSSYWAKQDGFYYYTLPLQPEAATETLIKSCKQIKERDGARLAVDISVQTVQSEPAGAVTDAWGIGTEADGALTVQGG